MLRPSVCQTALCKVITLYSVMQSWLIPLQTHRQNAEHFSCKSSLTLDHSTSLSLWCCSAALSQSLISHTQFTPLPVLRNFCDSAVRLPRPLIFNVRNLCLECKLLSRPLELTKHTGTMNRWAKQLVEQNPRATYTGQEAWQNSSTLIEIAEELTTQRLTWIQLKPKS